MNRSVEMTFEFATKRLAPWIVALFLLAGCGSLLETERPADLRMWLEPLGPGAAQGLDDLALQLNVRVVPGLDSERVLWLSPGGRLAQLGNARWADNLPEVLGSVMSRGLAAQGVNVTSRSVDEPGFHCGLQVEVEEFFAFGSEPPDSVRAKLKGLLKCGQDTVTFAAAAEPPVTPGTAGAISAFQQALDALTRSVLKQLAVAVAAHESSP